MKPFKLTAKYKRLKSYLHNTSWIFLERVIKIMVTFLVTIVLARYLGAKNYGLLAYSLSLTSLFSIAGHMGLSGLVVHEIVNKPDVQEETLGTSMVLKSIGMVLGYFFLFLYALLIEGENSPAFYLIIITGSAILFQPISVVDYWFQAFLQAKYAAISSIVSIILSSVYILILVSLSYSLFYFAVANVIQAVLLAVMLIIFFELKSGISIRRLRFDKGRAKDLLSQGWMVYLGSLFAVVYLKVDQVMIRWFVGAEEVGVYAVAAQLSEAWYFVPSAIMASFFPKLIGLKEVNESLYYVRMQQILDLLFIMGFSVAVIMTFLSEGIISSFYGSAYAGSSSILVIHIWAAVFIFMRAAFSKWILIEKALMFSLITQGFGALVNVVLNLYLIPRYGGQGAAVATLISYAMASFFSLFFYSKTRRFFWLMLYSIMSPIRYAYTIFASLRLK